MTGHPTVQDLFDPRGRVSRAGLLAVAVLLLAADVVAGLLIVASGAAFTGVGPLVFKLVSVWIATTAVAKRLHDLDLSAWWIIKGLLALVGWSIAVAVLLLTQFSPLDAVNPGHMAFWINVAVNAAPVLTALIWVHLAHGTPGPNRYGSEPGGRGFSSPASRATPSTPPPALARGVTELAA